MFIKRVLIVSAAAALSVDAASASLRGVKYGRKMATLHLGAPQLPAFNILSGEDEQPEFIGGDKSLEGCLHGAGFSWCERTQSCIRPWETEC